MSNFAALIATIQANIKTNGNEEITGAVLQDVLEAMVQALGTEAINNLETALGNEETARQNADGTLQDNIDAEALRAGTAEAGLAGDIAAEELRAKAAEQTNAGDIATINGKIPSAATTENKLADKAFVTTLTTALQNAINTIKSNIDNGYVYAGIATPSGTPVSGKVFYLAKEAGTYTNFGGLVVTQGINILKYNGTTWSQEKLIGIDDEPTAGSDNLVKSGGVAANIVYDNISQNRIGSLFTVQGYIDANGVIQSSQDWMTTDYIPIDVVSGFTYQHIYIGSAAKLVALYGENKNKLFVQPKGFGDLTMVDFNDLLKEYPNAKFVRLCYKIDSGTPVFESILHGFNDNLLSNYILNNVLDKVFCLYNTYIDTDGENVTSDSARYKATGDIDKRFFENIVLSAYNFSSSARMLSLCDINKDPVYVLERGDNTQIEIDFNKLLSDYPTAKYVRICYNPTNQTLPKFLLKYDDHITKDSKTLIRSGGIYNDLYRAFFADSILDKVFINDHTYLNGDGESVYQYSSPWKCTGIVSVEDVKGMCIEMFVPTSSARTIALYSSNSEEDCIWVAENGDNDIKQIVLDDIISQHGNGEATHIAIATSFDRFVPKTYYSSGGGAGSDGAIVTSITNGYQNLGYDEIQKPVFDYNIIINYGQSLSVGYSCLKDTIQGVENALMLGSSTRTVPGSISGTDYAAAENYVNNLNITRVSITGDSNAMNNIASSAIVANSLAAMYQRQRGENKKFLSVALGEGAKTIAQLMDPYRYVDTTTSGVHFDNLSGGGWYRQIIIALNRIKAIAQAENKTFGVVGVCWINGEEDNERAAGDDHYSCGGDKTLYMQRFRLLLNDLNTDIKTITGQTDNPAWFMSLLGGKFMTDTGFGINEAQYALIDELNVFALPPVYCVSNSSDGHPTGNGFVWMGELFTRNIYGVLANNLNSQRCRVKDVKAMGNKIYVSFYIPRPPLQFDTNTVVKMNNYGFVVKSNGTTLTIRSMEIVDDTVVLIMSNVVEGKELIVEYATANSLSSINDIAKGEGNLRDSTIGGTYFKYQQDMPRTTSGNQVEWQAKTQDGGNIEGDNYPMYFFCESFKVAIN